MKRYDLKITKTIVETVQASSYVEAVLAAELSLSNGGDMNDAFAKAEPQISDVHAPGEGSDRATRAPATQNEALALLNTALYAAKNVGLLATLEQNLERDCIDHFYKGVGELCVQFREFTEPASAEAVAIVNASLCACHTSQWSGSPNPANPDNEWICDDCDRVIAAEPRKAADSSAVWEMLHHEAAQREGWFLSQCNGSVDGPWQIQKIDYPEDNMLPDGTLPAQLEDDDQAMQIVANGTGDHHVFAREHLKAHNPKEYERIVAMKASATA